LPSQGMFLEISACSRHDEIQEEHTRPKGCCTGGLQFSLAWHRALIPQPDTGEAKDFRLLSVALPPATTMWHCTSTCYYPKWHCSFATIDGKESTGRIAFADQTRTSSLVPREMGEKTAAGLGTRRVRQDEGAVARRPPRANCLGRQKARYLRSIRKTMATDRPYGTVFCRK